MPLRLRLALWCGGLAGLVAAVVSLVGYALHSRAHYAELDRVLGGAADHLVEEFPGHGEPERHVAMLAIPVAPNLVARLYGPDGRLIAAGPGAELAPAVDPREIIAGPASPPYDGLVALAPPLVATRPAPGTFGLARGDGSRWRLYVRSLPGEAGDRGYLLVAASLADVDMSVDAFRRLIPPLIVLGTVVALLGGWLVAGRALRPVVALTDTAAGIARTRSFSRRVPSGARSDELGRLAATFNGMLDSLEEAYRAQQRFVSDASHELRAPLTAIQANLELLERQPEMPPAERQEAVGEAGREARRLVQLVADLLALARADAGVPLRRAPVELDRVVLDALTQARHLARGQRLEIGALEPVLTEGDSDRLKQLILVLLDNAIKYTPSSGRVCVELRRSGATAVVSVEDDGVGIASADLPHVFERFYRADPARTRDPGGTGLGLPIAAWIAQQHGGEISLESKPGRGTRAILRLPLAGRAQTALGEAPETSATLASGHPRPSDQPPA